MRLRTITLSWFRGAADQSSLALNGRSVAVFGANGAGKSSFVDAVEAILCSGKVGHLSHEYSGRNQERGLINTARPIGVNADVCVELADGSASGLRWGKGAAVKYAAGSTTLSDWAYRRTALRQEELSGFIQSTKGAKYSAVLPLLGLSHLEVVAENLHKLVKAIERKSGVSDLKQKVLLSQEQRQEVFAEQTDAELVAEIGRLRDIYAPEAAGQSNSQVTASVMEAIANKISGLDGDKRKSAAISELATSDVLTHLQQTQAGVAKIADFAEPLLRERLEVLRAAEEFMQERGDNSEAVPCPACGREIDPNEFRDHVELERGRLVDVAALYAQHRQSVAGICNEINRLRIVIAKPDLEAWRISLEDSELIGWNCLDEMATEELREQCDAEKVSDLQVRIAPLLSRALTDSASTPPPVQTLVDDQQKARTLRAVVKAANAKRLIRRVDNLMKLVSALEAEVRDEINERARITLEDISEGIQRYWDVLNPGETIAGVELVVPDDADKAIEVSLKFYGHQQDSPRLTLSEGQRNALGLCIFLSMASKVKEADRPIILDDVVISFDREHRSRVAKLLCEEFADRQIVVLTHDREWFFELQQTLPRKSWDFRRLIPYSQPENGISFADQGLDIAVARARASIAPEEALANMRRIMDVGLSEIAERIRLPVAHMRGDANDHRTAGHFLVAIERLAGKAFKRREGADYVSNTSALDAIRKSKPELSIWANRGTHTYSGSTTEAEDLIDGCEEVLNSFTCQACNTPVGAFPSSGGKLECRCGVLQWRM